MSDYLKPIGLDFKDLGTEIVKVKCFFENRLVSLHAVSIYYDTKRTMTLFAGGS